jgi:Flp pilus assembly protein TadD
MRKVPLALTCLVVAGILAGCEQGRDAQTARAIDSVASIDQQNMAELMLATADPREAVTYFSQAAQTSPDRILFQRGLARSLARAGRAEEALPIWERVIAHPEATLEDRVELADAHIRAGNWDQAQAVLNAIPPTHETFHRYRLEAMIADTRRQWDRADHFYEVAVGLTPRPAGVLNNWGFSRLTRGDHRGAERLFLDALTHDPSLFTAKNNLALARAGQRRYELPLIEMTQIERAQLLHTMALAAVRQGDVAIGRGLLQEAIATHPQHFEAAVTALRAIS